MQTEAGPVRVVLGGRCRHPSPRRRPHFSNLGLEPACGDLLLATCHIGAQSLADRWIHGRLLIAPQQFFPYPICAPRAVEGAGFLPGFEIAPIREQGRIEGRLVALQSVADTEEMPAGADL